MTFPTFHQIYSRLLQFPAPLLSNPSPRSTQLTSQIASLLLHPTLEAALHLLNHDLAAAHFLVRHMQSPPAYEGMFLHGILHRIEGDFDNARCWYSDCRGSDVFEKVWGVNEEGTLGFKDVRNLVGFREDFGIGGVKEGEMDAGQRFLNRVETLKKGVAGGDERVLLEGESKRELETVINHCIEKFGDGKWEDASSAWVKNSEEISKISEEQVNGDAGHRKF